MNYLDDEIGPWITDQRPRNISQKIVSASRTEQKEHLRSILSGRQEKLPKIRSQKFSVSPEPIFAVRQQHFNDKFIVAKSTSRKIENPHCTPKHYLMRMKTKHHNYYPRLKQQQTTIVHEQIVEEIEKIIRRNASNKPKLSYF